jgi:hypothetical protein
MPDLPKKECSVADCSRKLYAKGLCEMHWRRLRKYGDPLGGHRNHAPVDVRFFRRVEKTSDCWLWTGNRQPNGYGRIQTGGKGSPHVGVHRLSYEIHHGPIPEGMVVMHACDTPACVNPAHLSVGTYRDNTADMTAKGRRRGRIILTCDQVFDIRASKEPARVLAPIYGVSKSTIWAVRTGQNWKEVQ